MRSNTSLRIASLVFGSRSSLPPSCPRRIGPCCISTSVAADRFAPSALPCGDLADRRPSVARLSTLRVRPDAIFAVLSSLFAVGAVSLTLGATPATAAETPYTKAALAWAAKHHPPGADLNGAFVSCFNAGYKSALCRIFFFPAKYNCEEDIFVSTVTYAVQRQIGTGCHHFPAGGPGS
jgi:hypothetical protein